MADPRSVRCYQYVNRPYAGVRRLLNDRALAVFQRATNSATGREGNAAAHAAIGGIDVSVPVELRVKDVRDEDGPAGQSPRTRVVLSWLAAKGGAVLPALEATLAVWPLDADECQLELEGIYQPPLGPVGAVLDAAVGHLIAERTLRRFLEDVIEQVRSEVPPRVRP